MMLRAGEEESMILELSERHDRERRPMAAKELVGIGTSARPVVRDWYKTVTVPDEKILMASLRTKLASTVDGPTELDCSRNKSGTSRENARKAVEDTMEDIHDIYMYMYKKI